MLIPALISFFKYRVVRNIIVLACWSPFEQNQFIRDISKYGFAATFSCDAAALEVIHCHGLQGVLYFQTVQSDGGILEKLKTKYFSGHYQWLVIGSYVPTAINQVRYDDRYETSWDDLESRYLKKKKKNSKFYQVLEQGVKLVEDGSTAFHTEYNQIYPHFKTFTDDQICKLQHVDTIPEVMTWITATPHGQYSNTFRAAGAWLHETGLGKRLVTSLQALRPHCRAQLLAERVKFGDVAPLMGLTTFGAVISLVILGIKILVAYYK